MTYTPILHPITGQPRVAWLERRTVPEGKVILDALTGQQIYEYTEHEVRGQIMGYTATLGQPPVLAIVLPDGSSRMEVHNLYLLRIISQTPQKGECGP